MRGAPFEVRMSDVLALTVRDFLTDTAARQPTPGGGSVAALCGALAASLGAMAVEYTLGKKTYAPYDAELRASLARFANASRMLQELVAEDIAAYEGLSQLLKLPEQERLGHPDFIPALVAAIRVPQTAGGFALDVLETCGTLVEKTSKFLVSDLGIAATYAHATVLASEFNVLVNLPLLPDPAEAAAVRQSLAQASARAQQLFPAIREGVVRRIA
jgi:formiminotetrahydrofolate cyclodeaminase